jgi:hypothetical protein
MNNQYAIEVANNGFTLRKFQNNVASLYVFADVQGLFDYLNADLVPVTADSGVSTNG